MVQYSDNPENLRYLKDAPMPPLPFAKDIKKVQTESSLTTGEMIKKIDEMLKSHDKLFRQLEDVFQKIGWTSRYLEEFFANPNNFSEGEWERYNREREAFMNSLDLPLKPPKKALSQDSPKQHSRKKAATRRNWLPMR